MATPVGDSYAVTSGGVIAAGRNIFFSSGAEAGSYNAGTQVWTPGRDSNGVVTRASWALVPTDGTWVEVAGTAFTTQVQPLLTAALPAYNDPGSSDLASVLNAYNGFAHDVAGGRVFAHGGGHQDGANNGIYRCDLKKLTWAIAKLPDMPTYWPSGYKANPPTYNSYTHYDSARIYCDANLTTADVGYDEFYDPAQPLASTRNPTARHTYQAMVFGGGKVRHGVRRYWEWCEASDTWISKYPHGKNYTTHQQVGGGNCGENVKGTWDEVNNRYICTPTQISSVPSQGWAWNEATQTWSIPPNLIGGWEAYSAVFARRAREWCSFARPTRQGTYYPPALKCWNLDTHEIKTVSLSGIEQAKCVDASKYDESSVIEYVGAVNKFFVLMPYDADDLYADTATLPLESFWIDTSTGTMTREIQSGKWPVLTSNSLIKNKLFYVPQIKALVIFPDATSNARIRRFP